MNLRRVTAYLHSADVLIIGFASLLTVINVVFACRIPHWREMIIINCVATTLICLLAYAHHAASSRILRFIHDWYVPPVVFFSFKELYFMIRPIHLGRDYDDVLIALDRWLFGVNPTEWLMQFSHPVLTEVLQIAYTSFYLLFLILGYELYRRHNLDLFRYFVFTCTYGFFLSYIGYFFLPAVGPRFTLHDFAALDHELPGLLLTESLRWFVNAGESIPMNVPNEVAIAGTQRDVFPSGHTMMTLVLMHMSARYHLKVRNFIFGVGTLLIMATVYQRYHYVIDLVGGAVFMLICVTTSPALYVRIKSHFQTIESRLPPA